MAKYVEAGYDIVSIDPRGLGETRMRYKAVSPDDPALAKLDFDDAYQNSLSGVLAGYVYNSLLTGRPYFLQMIEDVEIAARFVSVKAGPPVEMAIVGAQDSAFLAAAVAETLPHVKLLPQSEAAAFRWSEIVNQKKELWPIQYLFPGGAYIH